MQCPNCGTDLPDEAQFCFECGASLKELTTSIPTTQVAPEAPKPMPDTIRRPAASPAPGSSLESQAPAKPAKKRLPTRAIVAIVIALVLVACGTGALVYALSSAAPTASQAATRTPHPVVTRVSIDGYEDGSSRIPIHVTGEDVDGNKVDKVVYLAFSGPDMELVAGTYHMEAVGSPIASDGTIYTLPTRSIDITLGDDLEEGETFEFPENLYFAYTVIEPEDMTQAQIDDAVEWARKDEQSGADVDKLAEAAKARMQQASAG